MSKTIRALALISPILVGLLFASCSKVSENAGPGANVPFEPGVLRYADISEPDSLNPLLSTQLVVADIEYLTFSFFFRYDDQQRFVPDIALVEPTLENGLISKDGKTITYHLRRGVKWQDGAPLDAKDVVFTFHAIMNPNNNVQVRTGYDQIADVTAPDDYTVIVHMKRVFSPIIAYFMCQQGGFPIVPAHLLAKYPNVNNIPYNTKPVGSGPFRITEWVHGDHITMEASPSYYRGPPKLKKIVYRFIASTNTIKVQLQTHETDAWFRANTDVTPELEKIPGIVVKKSPENLFAHIDFNVKDPILSDLRVRKAIEYSLNRREMVANITHNINTMGNSDIAEYSWAFPKDLAIYDNDPAKAKALLDEAGWKPGPDGVRVKNGQRLELQFSLVSGSSTGEKIASLVQAAAKNVGIAVTIKGYPAAVYFGAAQTGGILNGGKYQLGSFSWSSGVDPDNSSIYGCEQFPPKGQNNLFWCDPKLEAAEQDALSTFDQKRRIKDYEIIERELIEQVPTIFLWHSRRVDALSEHFHGFVSSPATSANWNAWEWSMQ
jgi:peptide/nickel transport system substrate-binding protein